MLVFRAQALDNTSPDYIELRGEQLSPDDSAKREEAASIISNIIKTGSRVFDQNGVRLTADSRRFVVEVHSAERDLAGRIAPIIGCGDYDSTIGNAFGAAVADDLNDFARRIGRTVLPEHFELTRESFAALKKKFSTKKFVRAVGIGAVGLILLALMYWLVRRGH